MFRETTDQTLDFRKRITLKKHFLNASYWTCPALPPLHEVLCPAVMCTALVVFRLVVVVSHWSCPPCFLCSTTPFRTLTYKYIYIHIRWYVVRSLIWHLNIWMLVPRALSHKRNITKRPPRATRSSWLLWSIAKESQRAKPSYITLWPAQKHCA